MNFTRYRNYLPWLLGLLMVALFVWSTLGVIRRVGAGRRLDFFHFYEAAQAVVGGEDIYLSGSGGYIYPPLLAVLFAPFSQVSHDTAVYVWLGINIALTLMVFFAGWLTLVERFKLEADRRTMVCVVSLAALMSSEQIRWQLILGQTDALTMAGCTLALLWLNRRPLLAGIMLGGVSNIKYQALLLLPYLLVRKHFRATVGVILGAAAFALLPALVLGWEKNLAYLAVAFGGMLEMIGIDVERAAAVPVLTWKRSITLTSALARISEHLGHGQSLAIPLAGLLSAVILGVVWGLYHRHRLPFMVGRGGHAENAAPFPAVTAIEWCGLLIAISIFSPQGTKRHFFLLLLVNLTIVFLLWTARIPATRRILLVGVIVSQLALRLPPTPAYESAAAVWDFVGGPSWGILVLCIALVHAGLQEASATRNHGVGKA